MLYQPQLGTGLGDWWTDIPLTKRLGTTAAISIGGAAMIGFFQAERPGVGLFLGSAVGFMIWGIGWTLYTSNQILKHVPSLTPSGT